MSVYRAMISTIAISALGLISYAAYADSTEEFRASVDELSTGWLEDTPMAGLSVGVSLGDEIIFAEAYGFADLEHDVPATVDTVYAIASVTKPFTAAAVLNLAQEGKVNLDAEVSDYLPEYNDQGNQVTITHLLNHTSGIRRYTMTPAFFRQMRLPLNHDQVLATFQNEPFEFQPGEQFRYNTSGYYLLGMIIERVSGMTYSEYLELSLFRPLGLESIRYMVERPLIKHRARGYARSGDTFVNATPIAMTHAGGSGGLCSTVTDLLLWQEALHGGEILNGTYYEKMISPGSLYDGTRTDYGFGLWISNLDGHRKFEHGGNLNGFESKLSYYPAKRIGIAILTNTERVGLDPMEEEIAQLAFRLVGP